MSGDVRACSSCGAPVRFVRSRATGGWMILDLEPVKGGNITIDEHGLAVLGGDVMTLDLFARPGDAELVARCRCALSVAGGAGGTCQRCGLALRPATYRVHHASCPNAGAHRKGGR